MVGGDEDAVERVRPLFEMMGKTIVRQGGPGAGQHTKMVNQILIASGMIGVCEALLYAYKAGLDLETRAGVGRRAGAAGSWSLSNYGPRMLKGDFEPGFVVEHFVKDMGIALAEARRIELSLPGLALAEQLYVALAAQGKGRKGTQSLILALATLSNVDWQAATSTRSRSLGAQLQTDPPSSRRSRRRPQRMHVGGRMPARTSSVRTRTIHSIAHGASSQVCVITLSVSAPGPCVFNTGGGFGGRRRRLVCCA